MPAFTVLTPTYNRAHTLPALAASLLAQEDQDYEWLLADDGSSDGTEALARGLEPRFNGRLRYYRWENGGKHRALNRAAPLARGAFTLIVDSDDTLPPRSLASYRPYLAQAAGPGMAGVMALRQDPEGRVIGEELPLTASPADTAALAYRYGVRGDKAELFRTEVLVRYPFPEFEGERFLTEAVAWNRMARDGLKFVLSNERAYTCEYLAGGLSDRSLELRLKNPRGNLLYYRECLELPFPARLLWREGINYARFSWHEGRPLGALAGLSPKAAALAALCLPAGAAAAALDRARLAAKRAQKGN